MDIRLEDLPTLEGAGRFGRQNAANAAVTAAYAAPAARTGISSGSVAFGLRAVNLLRDRLYIGAKDIAEYGAPAVSYETYYDCAGYQYNGPCGSPCFGFEDHHMDPFYCGTCAEQAADPANNPPWFWHFVGMRGATTYKDMEVNACQGKDAWKWDVGACGSCGESAVYRCHDGWKKYPNSNTWDPTICEALVSCDGKFRSCD